MLLSHLNLYIRWKKVHLRSFDKIKCHSLHYRYLTIPAYCSLHALNFHKYKYRKFPDLMIRFLDDLLPLRSARSKLPSCKVLLLNDSSVHHLIDPQNQLLCKMELPRSDILLKVLGSCKLLLKVEVLDLFYSSILLIVLFFLLIVSQYLLCEQLKFSVHPATDLP